MNEVVFTFGESDRLIGTLTQPEPGTKQAPIGVVLMNAGVIHRIGPHRFNVKLARHLSGKGFATLRFDLSGQGDSRPASTSLSFEKQSVRDIREALDRFSRISGLQRFAIVGICSGAINGQNAALEDPRIVALWMIDGIYYPTAKTQQFSYANKLRTRLGWGLVPWLVSRSIQKLKLASRRVMSRASFVAEPPPGSSASVFPSKTDYAAEMQMLCSRGVDSVLHFTGSMSAQFNYPEQLRDAFPDAAFVDHVRCNLDIAVDHTLSTLTSQRVVIESVSTWLQHVQVNKAAPSTP